jgi:thiosulfate dehydrogenase
MWTMRTLCGVLFVVLCSVQTRVGAGAETETGEPVGHQAAIDAVFTPPSPETIPSGPRGEQIRLGYEIVVHTQQYAKRYVGNKLNCTNCHLDAGLNPNAASFVGLSVQYPEYRARAGRQVTLAERINECVERSLNGKALPPDSSKLQAVIAYIEWLSQNVPAGSTVAWRGISPLTPIKKPDPVRGKAVFFKKCFFCHGTDGQGTMAGPPLWGPGSYSIAAGMARISVAASFIKGNMPRGWGWTVSDHEAFDLAAYINSQPRQDFPGKKFDWPQGGKPEDSPY